jgi:hypothetical protein
MLSSQTLIDFATQNPQLEIATEIKPGRHPILTGDYGN